MSSFGRVFRITTFGESHCKSVGVIIDGCPPCMNLTEADIQPQLTRRRPGQSKITTPRDEADVVSILSGTEHGKTLGTPICLVVHNLNIKPKDYKAMSTIPRPGHADFTYQVKYGVRASSGGGRASARETIGRVAAGAVAEKFIKNGFGTEIVGFVGSVGHIELPKENYTHPSGRPWTRLEVDQIGTIRIIRSTKNGWKRVSSLEEQKELDEKDDKFFITMKDPENNIPAYLDHENKIYSKNGTLLKLKPEDLGENVSDDLIYTRCPCVETACKFVTLIREVKLDQDSIGGTAVCYATNVPVGLGEPVFDKLEAKLAQAMLSLPATKGFEFGSGFEGTKLRGSQHNDPFVKSPSQNGTLISQQTNNSGGTLGGISSGSDIYFRVAVKPVSSIGRAQETADFNGKTQILAAKGRHDPCVLPRVPPLLESMTALVIADAALLQLARTNSVSQDMSTVASQKAYFDSNPNGVQGRST